MLKPFPINDRGMSGSLKKVAFLGAFFLFGTLQTAHAQYCTSEAYYAEDEDIFNVTFGTLSNTSDCNSIGLGTSSTQNLYSDYSALPAPNITAGTTVPLSVEVGTCNTFGSVYNNVVGVFIDYNRDGVFSASELVYASPSSTSGPHFETANILIPTTISYGLTGMRVMCIEDSDPTSITGCASYGWGETEDYTINLVPATPPACVTTALTPADGETLCTGNVTLRWNKKLYATSYDVYLDAGSAAPTTLVSASQADTFYTFNATANNYNWKIIPKNGNIPSVGCTYFNFKPLSTITPDVIISRSPTADTLCPKDSVVFTAITTNGGLAPSYQWMNNGVNVGTNSSTITYNGLTAADSIYAVLTTSISGTCLTKGVDTSNVLRIQYRPAPSANITFSGSSSFCSGGTVLLTVPTGAVSYQWRNNGVNLGNAATNSYQVQYSGTYTARVTGANGCVTISDPTVVTAYAPPNPLLTRAQNTVSTANYYSTYQWYLNNVLIPGATASSYTFTHDGNYTVRVKDTVGCTGISAILPVNDLSIGTIPGAAGLSIYPNPAINVVHISSVLPVNVTIRSIEGKVVLQQNSASLVDVSSLASGIYMLYVTDKSNNLLHVEKLTKNAQ